MAEPEGKRKVRLDVPIDAHAKLRVLAARSGVSMARYCEAIVLHAVRDEHLLDEGDLAVWEAHAREHIAKEDAAVPKKGRATSASSESAAPKSRSSRRS